MASSVIVMSTCERCGNAVRTTEDFLDAVDRGEAKNLCDRCFWTERDPGYWRRHQRLYRSA